MPELGRDMAVYSCGQAAQNVTIVASQNKSSLCNLAIRKVSSSEYREWGLGVWGRGGGRGEQRCLCTFQGWTAGARGNNLEKLAHLAPVIWMRKMMYELLM